MNRHHMHTIKRMKNHILRMQSECNEVGDAVDLDMDLDSLAGIEMILRAQEGGDPVPNEALIRAHPSASVPE